MDFVNWDKVITNIITSIISLGMGGLLGFFRGKKKSSLAIERKDNLYQPLLTELTTQVTKKEIISHIYTPTIYEVVSNDYKYGLSKKIQNGCIKLNSLIEEYNKISVTSVAHNIIIDMFEKSYEELYGSKIDGISFQYDHYGNSIEYEHLAIPIKIIHRVDEQSIISLLMNEGIPDMAICIDQEDDIFDYVYGDLVSIFHSALYSKMNGEVYKLPKIQKDISMKPEEYMAVEDFFERFNKDELVIKKYRLRERIITESSEIIKELKVVIRKIVKMYEIEEI